MKGWMMGNTRYLADWKELARDCCLVLLRVLQTHPWREQTMEREWGDCWAAEWDAEFEQRIVIYSFPFPFPFPCLFPCFPFPYPRAFPIHG